MDCSLRACIEESISEEEFTTVVVCRLANLFVFTNKFYRIYLCVFQKQVEHSPHDVAAPCIRLPKFGGTSAANELRSSCLNRLPPSHA